MHGESSDLTAGVGWVQARGEEKRILRAGDVSDEEYLAESPSN